MTILQFDIVLPKGTSDAEAEAAAALLKDDLARLQEVEKPEAEYTGPERSAGDIVQAIMVAAPIVATTATLVKNTDTILSFLQKLVGMFKSEPEEKPGAVALQQVNLDSILFRIGDQLVPATALTQEHLAQLAAQNS